MWPLAAMLSLFFFACSKAPSPASGEASPPAAEQAGRAVNFITWNEDYLAALKKEVPLFEQKTGIKVSWQLLSEDIVRDKVLLDLASHAGAYDVVLTDVWIMPEHVASGYLEPLDSYIERDLGFDPGVWYARFLDALKYGGRQYALPTESFGATLVYRKDLFDRHKVKVPETIDDIANAARKLTIDTDKDGTIDIYGVVSRAKAGEEPAIIVSGFAWAYGGTWFEKGASTAEEIKKLRAKPAFDTPQFLAGFKKYCDLLSKYGPPNIKDYTWYEMVEDGKKGNVAMILYSGFNVGAVDKDSVGMRDKYYAALPAKGPMGHVQEAFAMGYGINKDSRNKDAAWEFIKFIAGRDFMKNVIDAYATSVAVKSLREGESYRSRHPYKTPKDEYVLEKEIELIDWRYMPRLPEYSVIANRLGTATSEVIAGRKSAEAALRELNETVYNLMIQAGYYKKKGER